MTRLLCGWELVVTWFDGDLPRVTHLSPFGATFTVLAGPVRFLAWFLHSLTGPVVDFAMKNMTFIVVTVHAEIVKSMIRLFA